jgi:hypothetical protein
VKHLVIVLAAVAGSAAVATPAAAQYYGAEVDIISPREATEVVRAAGLDPISRPVWRPGRYIVHAIDRYGRELRVIVDARMGDVVRAVPASGYADIPPRGYEPYPRPEAYPRAEPYPHASMPPAEMEAPEEEFDNAGVPPPGASPHVIPAPRSAAPAPSRSSALPAAPKPQAAKPAAAPIPRARPADAMASNSAAEPKTESAAATEAPKEIRKIDMSKPKPAETSPAPAGPEVKALEDPNAKPRF